MDSIEPQPSSSPDVNELKEQLISLRQLVHSLLIVLVIISGTLNIYLLRQYKFNKSDLNSVRPQAAAVSAEYDKNKRAMTDFISKLFDYGQKHPDFEPIMTKYRLRDLVGKPAGAPGLEPLAPANPKK